MTTIPQTRTLAYFLVCLFLFGCINFLMGPLMSYIRPQDHAAALVYASFGAAGAQAGLHAVWCVLAPVGFAMRFTVGVGTGLLLFGAWAMGQGVHVNGQPYLGPNYWQVVVTALLCLPLFAIAIQLPLWLVRMWCGWRILHRADPNRQSGHEAFGIRDLLVATAMVAAAFSAARLGVSNGNSSRDVSLLPLVIGAGVAAVVSLLVTLPAVAATLRARRLWLVLPAIVPLYVLAMFGVVAGVAALEGRRPSQVPYYGMVFTAGGCYACLVGVMLLARKLGYRLSWGRRQPEDGQ